MPGEIITRFRVLLAQKAENERRNITLKEVQIETGIAWTTLKSWTINDVTRFDSPVIVKLCDYLQCDIKDLIIYKREVTE